MLPFWTRVTHLDWPRPFVPDERDRSAFSDIGVKIDSDGEVPETLPGDGWREDSSACRFIQFSFEENWFCFDMPLQTLFHPEAEEILRYRKDFFGFVNRKEFTLPGEDVEGFDPFRKIYIYGAE